MIAGITPFFSRQLRTSLVTVLLVFSMNLSAQEPCRYITIDQFGYLPDSRKIAVIRNPVIGWDAGEEYCPGEEMALVSKLTGAEVFRGKIRSWNDGNTDPSSGDQIWYFDFSGVSEPGEYFILDLTNHAASYPFRIAGDVYNEVLKQAVRTFYYQRAGYPKEARYAGVGWADEASHTGPLQDLHCRSFFDKENPLSEKDVSGGWFDAGDYNKYTNWTANYVVELLKAYRENPAVWGDDYNLPWSGNGQADLLDEVRWGLDHLLKLQQDDGSVLSIVGLSHASPPSAAKGPSYHGPVSTSATLNTAAAFALGSVVFSSAGDREYGDLLLKQAKAAWSWADAHPEVLFNNNDPEYHSTGLGAGRQEVSDYQRGMVKLEAACYLFFATGEAGYRDYFDTHYQDSHLVKWSVSIPFDAEEQDMLLFYAGLESADPVIAKKIRSSYTQSILEGKNNLPAILNETDPYHAYIKDYTWGSNSVKSCQGSMYYHMFSCGSDPSQAENFRNIAQDYLHYIHGVNPQGMVYLSNMYAFGAENCVNEFYHSWFCNGSALWDRVGSSTYGPPPGYLTGGPNPHYRRDRCCPDSCGEEKNNEVCDSEPLVPPLDQPEQKSYKDFNTSWPLNSWEITENSCGYQVNYIRLLSKFAGSVN
ncbi:MAG: glycoside hydrolase family 9 protein [Bacteroidota bacterium]